MNVNDDKSNPLISIITVVLNDKNNIEKTIKSVLIQDYKLIEYIIIDGGSTDGTIDIIGKFQSQIDVIVSEKDKGIYDAMNKGLKRSKGEWVNFLNSGDIFSGPNVISILLEKYYMTDYDIIYGDKSMKLNLSIVRIKALELKKIHFRLPFCHQSAFVKRDLLIDQPFNLKYKICADYDFFLRMYFKKMSFQYASISVVDFDGDGLSNSYLAPLENIKVLADSGNLNLYNLISSLLILTRSFFVKFKWYKKLKQFLIYDKKN